MTYPTLKDLRDQIAEYGPEHFNMSLYLADDSSGVFTNFKEFNFNRCGAVGCVIGHGGILLRDSGFKLNEENWWAETREYFDIPQWFVGCSWSRVAYRDTNLHEHHMDLAGQAANPFSAMFQAALDWLDWYIEIQESADALEFSDLQEEGDRELAYAT